MSEVADADPLRTPRHLWAVGIVGFLWNSMGAFDYLMTKTRNESYMSRFTPEQLEFFYGFPAWVVAFWAIAVWGGLLGAALLLLRKRVAVPMLLASFVAMVVTAIQNYFLSNGMEVLGTVGVLFTILIFLVALGLWRYARAMARRGVLA